MVRSFSSENHRQGCPGSLRGPVDRILGAVVAENIFPRHILEYQRKRRDDKVSNRTINKELNYLSGCLRWASSAENGYITPRQWKIGKLPYNKPIPKILSVEETIRILDAAEPFYKAMFLCLYSIGLRMDEARNLKWRDIDRENNTVIVRQKGGSFKRLPLNSMLLAALDDIAREKTTESYIKKIEKFLKENTNKTIEDYIFLNPQTGKPITRIVRAIERACEKAKVEKHVYPHLFRHSVATHMLGQNINLRTIQGYLGHSQISTTEWYTHVLSSHLDKASDTIMAGLMKANNSG
ncbi:MAG: tyrosine-type recombinase/integrase [Candidatus Omnitrophota bacterium]